jgi:Transposase DDE domain group 1
MLGPRTVSGPARTPGLRNLPFHDAAQNRVWPEVCALAADLIAWTQRLALTGWARIAEPKRLRLRLFGVAARLVRTGRRLILKIPDTWPWAEQITAAHARLAQWTGTSVFVPDPTSRTSENRRSTALETTHASPSIEPKQDHQM